jgi:hypothetical protein
MSIANISYGKDSILTDRVSGCLFTMDSFPEDIPAMKCAQHRVEIKCEWGLALTRIVFSKDPRKIVGIDLLV